MTVRIEHESEHATLEVHPEQHLIRSTWRGNISGAEYRTNLLNLLRIVERDKLLYWLSDGRKMGPILYDDQVWSMKVYTPMVMQAGIERIAIVSSKDVLNVMAVDKMVSATPVEAPYTIAFFEDPSIAMLWLLKKETESIGVSKK